MQTRIQVEDVQIDGNRKTHGRLFDHILQKTYESINLNDLAHNLTLALEKLKSLDAFNKVEFLIDESVLSTSDYENNTLPIALKINVEEKSTAVLQAGTYIESRSSDAGFETKLGLRNPFGGLEKLFVEGSYGRDESSSFSFNWLKPYAFGYDANLSVLLSSQTNNYLTSSSYQERCHEAEIKLSNFGNTSISYVLAMRNILPQFSDLRTDPLFSPTVSHRTGLFKFKCAEDILQHIYPNVKSSFRLNSSRIFGSARLKGEVEFSGNGIGGETNFLKGTFENQVYQQLSPSFYTTLTVRLGYLLSSDAKASHLSDRFYLGGPLDLRGFKRRGASPHVRHIDSSDADAIGGDMMWSTGISLHHDIPIETVSQTGLQFLCFLNAGNVSRSGTPISNFLTSIRSTCGFGLVFPFQAGRIELTYAFILKAEKMDNIQKIQLGVGIDFL